MPAGHQEGTIYAVGGPAADQGLKLGETAHLHNSAWSQKAQVCVSKSPAIVYNASTMVDLLALPGSKEAGKTMTPQRLPTSQTRRDGMDANESSRCIFWGRRCFASRRVSRLLAFCVFAGLSAIGAG